MKHEFVEFIPVHLNEGVLYISIKYGTASHKCCCGCGNEVVTPLSPTDWRIIYDGETVSLYPSVGSWNLDCRSHYWIENGAIEWAKAWSNEQIEAARMRDQFRKETYFRELRSSPDQVSVMADSKQRAKSNKKEEDKK